MIRRVGPNFDSGEALRRGSGRERVMVRGELRAMHGEAFELAEFEGRGGAADGEPAVGGDRFDKVEVDEAGQHFGAAAGRETKCPGEFIPSEFDRRAGLGGYVVVEALPQEERRAPNRAHRKKVAGFHLMQVDVGCGSWSWGCWTVPVARGVVGLGVEFVCGALWAGVHARSVVTLVPAMGASLFASLFPG